MEVVILILSQIIVIYLQGNVYKPKGRILILFSGVKINNYVNYLRG